MIKAIFYFVGLVLSLRNTFIAFNYGYYPVGVIFFICTAGLAWGTIDAIEEYRER